MHAAMVMCKRKELNCLGPKRFLHNSEAIEHAHVGHYLLGEGRWRRKVGEEGGGGYWLLDGSSCVTLCFSPLGVSMVVQPLVP